MMLGHLGTQDLDVCQLQLLVHVKGCQHSQRAAHAVPRDHHPWLLAQLPRRDEPLHTDTSC